MARMQTELNGHCTVCGRRLARRLEYGGRIYCEQHYNSFVDDVQPLWQTSVFMFGLLVAVVIAIAVAGLLFDLEVTGRPRVVLGVALSILPGLMWLFFLTRLAAARQVEVSPLLPTVFVLSALIAVAVAHPLVYELIDLDAWLARATPVNRLLANILLGGSIHAFLLYAIIRYTVWQTPAFERRVDGIIFSLVAAWGYAATFNTIFVLDYGGVSLVNGSFRLFAQTCAFLVPGLIIGYFLGVNRFEDRPFYYLTIGVALSAFLNGFLMYAGVELNNIRVNLATDGFSPWPGLVLTFGTLLATYAAVFGLLRRENSLTRARIERKAS